MHVCGVTHLPLVATVAAASMQHCSVSRESLECAVMWDASASQQREPSHVEVRAQQPIRSQCQGQIAVFSPLEQPRSDDLFALASAIMMMNTHLTPLHRPITVKTASKGHNVTVVSSDGRTGGSHD